MPSNNTDPYRGLDPAFAAALRAMITESGGKIRINNGYRSIEQQTYLYNKVMKEYGRNDIPGKQVAKPGSSQHNFGFAADLEGDLRLANQLGKKYGLHFPVKGEAWHVEPIGARKNGGHARSGIQHVDEAIGQPDQDVSPNVKKTMDAFAGLIYGTMGEAKGMMGEQDSSLLAAAPEAETPEEATGSLTQEFSPGGQPAGGDELDRLMGAIGSKESNNNYDAVNKDSGAHGKYQIMPANWPSWAKEAGLPANAPKTPENQERVARHKMAQYLAKYGAEGAAQAWYGGPGSVGKNVSGGYGGKYPTSNQYRDDIKKRMG